MEKQRQKPGVLDLAFEMIRTGADIVGGRMPKPENYATPQMKHVAKGLGDLAIFGWSKPKKKG